MPLSNREFVQIVKKHSSDGAADSTLASALRESPFDTNPDQSEQKRRFVRGLPETDRQTLSLLLQDAAEGAVAGVLCVLDGVGGSYAGTFEVYAVDPDDSKSPIVSEYAEMLHDIYSEFCYGSNSE